ncbi:hypothetical protein [Undibacterium sp. Di24W]|uniref:hypothetical protein n=1 Tax=Undibacterium sp. Di24W TaxID=3413033 RepID=UPI003BEFDD96
MSTCVYAYTSWLDCYSPIGRKQLDYNTVIIHFIDPCGENSWMISGIINNRINKILRNI